MSFWFRFEQSYCYYMRCQCEAARDAFIRQPSAFWTSLAYIFAGLAIYLGVKEKDRELKLWTLTCCLMGVSSLFGHMSFIRIAFAFDFASIILVLSFFAVLNFLKKFSTTKMLILFALYYAGLYSAMYYMGKWSKISTCLMIFAVSLGEVVKKVEWKFHKERDLHLSLGILAMSFVFFILDEMHMWCDPDSLFQWHSLWHIGTGLSMYFYGKWRFKVAA